MASVLTIATKMVTIPTMITMMMNHIATSVAIQPDDFETTPFYERGGLVKAHQVFGEKLDEVLDELNKVLTG